MSLSPQLDRIFRDILLIITTIRYTDIKSMNPDPNVKGAAIGGWIAGTGC